MLDAEVQGDPLDPASSLDLLGSSQSAVENAVSLFRAELTKAARRCAYQDECDAVSVKHVRKAEFHVGRLLASGRHDGVSPHVWWLAAGSFLAVALAIPDAGTMFLGSVDHQPVHKAWWFLSVAFAVLVFLGLLCLGVSFLMALGPYQPKWFVAITTAVGKLSKKG